MIFHLNLSVWAAGRTTIEVITMSCLILRRVGGKAEGRGRFTSSMALSVGLQEEKKEEETKLMRMTGTQPLKTGR
jgi:hypothetical protein